MSTVNFLDNRFETTIRKAINKPVGNIALEDLNQINGIAITQDGSNIIQIPWQSDGDAFNMKFPDLFCVDDEIVPEKLYSDLKYFSHIKTLHINIPLENLSFLKGFTSLKELYITGCKTEDWSFLEDLISLKFLSIRKSNFSNLKPIGVLCKKQKEIFKVEEQKVLNGEKTREHLLFNVPCLTNLELNKCQITHIEPLAEGKHLFDLNLSHNRISDLKPLTNLEQLYYLTLRWNEIEDLTPLQGMKGLYYLNLRHNWIKDIRIFEKYEKYYLRRLFLKHNEITNYTPLKDLRLVHIDVQEYTRRGH